MTGECYAALGVGLERKGQEANFKCARMAIGVHLPIKGGQDLITIYPSPSCMDVGEFMIDPEELCVTI